MMDKIDFSDFEYFDGGPHAKRTFEINGVPTLVEFESNMVGQIPPGKREMVSMEDTSFTVYTEDHLRERRALGRRLCFGFLDGAIESFGVDLDDPVGDVRWVVTEDVFEIDRTDIAKGTTPDLQLYLRQARYMKERFHQGDLRERENGISFVREVTSVATNYAVQMLEQLQESRAYDDRVIARKLEKILGADHELRIVQTNYVLKSKAIPMRNRGLTYGEAIENLKPLGMEVEKSKDEE